MRCCRHLIVDKGNSFFQNLLHQRDSAPGSIVTLAPDPAGPGMTQRYQRVNTDQNGRFDMKGITPGSYRVYAWDQLEPGEQYDPDMLKAHADKSAAVTVAEVSSFQLETIESFRPEIGVLLNLTPDHLDRHGTFEEYARAKMRMFENQLERDIAVLTLLYGCGLRISEALGLTRRDAPRGETITITGKGNKQRLVPVLPAVREAVGDYLAAALPLAARIPQANRREDNDRGRHGETNHHGVSTPRASARPW